ncbi:MAG: hypothetical protein ACAI37_17745 [Chthoniobacter sp.]
MPELFRSPEVNPIIFAEAVNHFVAMGEKRAVSELMNYDSERVCWVCRLLFFSRKGKPLLDMPKTNGPWKAPYNEIPDFDFPWFPVATVGHSSFVLVKATEFGGIKEPVKTFLARYEATGVFRTKPIPVPTRAEVQADAEQLRKSSNWLDIPWGKVGPSEDDGKAAEAEAWKSIKAQADSTR